MRSSNEECELGCEKCGRLYVAISAALNMPAISMFRPWKDAYVFKVGYTLACHSREFTLNRDVPGNPAYAGVMDWKLIQCWKVKPQNLHRPDKTLFLPWAKQHIGYIKPQSDCSGIAREELYSLRYDQVFADCCSKTGSTQNDEIIEVARRSLRSMIETKKIVDYCEMPSQNRRKLANKRSV